MLKLAKMFNGKGTSILCLLYVLYEVMCTMNTAPNIGDTLRQCLISYNPSSFGHCLGTGAINKLQSLDSDPEFDLIDGVTLTRDQMEFREPYNFAEHDPSNVRGIIDSFSHVLSTRNMRWDMSSIYPGLLLKIAPSTSPGGTLEFALDPHRESLNALTLKEASTGRLLARQFLVPFLLGFKFNVVTILPIIFGLLALVAKKAVLLSKIALVVSSAFGLGTLLLGNDNGIKYPPSVFPTQEDYNPYGTSHYTRFPAEDFREASYRGMGKQSSEDQLRLYGNVQPVFDSEDESKARNVAWNEEEPKGRNFVWDEDEKKKKSLETS